MNNQWLRVDYNRVFFQRRNSDCKIDNMSLEEVSGCNSSRGTNKSVKN